MTKYILFFMLICQICFAETWNDVFQEGKRYVVKNFACDICKQSDALYFGQENIFVSHKAPYKEWKVSCERCQVSYPEWRGMTITEKIYHSPQGLIINRRAYHDNMNKQMEGVQGWVNI